MCRLARKVLDLYIPTAKVRHSSKSLLDTFFLHMRAPPLFFYLTSLPKAKCVHSTDFWTISLQQFRIKSLATVCTASDTSRQVQSAQQRNQQNEHLNQSNFTSNVA